MSAYYNELDPFCAEWLRNLIAAGHIAPGDVDERSITAIRPDDLLGYRQCHFFAGIGGWSFALRLAGWTDDRHVWTGSCPCQPFSSVLRGRSLRRNDAKHLWPIWSALVAELTPNVVLGEQVATAGDWFDGVCDDMERMGYAVGAAILPATAIGQSHARSRIYFACHTDSHSESGMSVNGQMARMQRLRSYGGQLPRKNGVSTSMAKVLSGLGNSIVPQVAAEFIQSVMECIP